jgi:hypothetical protein
MAGQELLGTAEVGIRGIRVFVARGEKDFGGRYEENLNDVGLASAHVIGAVGHSIRGAAAGSTG